MIELLDAHCDKANPVQEQSQINGHSKPALYLIQVRRNPVQ